MPAFRGKNLRSGDLSEQFGYYLLQTMALVAPVPRTEDVGIDAVCTLYQEFDLHRILARDSFYIQIKSDIVNEIHYTGDELKWLSNLKLPFFVGLVNRKANSMSIFATYEVHSAFVSNSNRSELKLIPNKDLLQTDFPDPRTVEVGLGRPIVTWDINDSHGKEFSRLFYETVSEHVSFTNSILRTRESGWVETVGWETNSVPKSLGWKSQASATTPKIIDDIADVLMPHFSMMMDYCKKFSDDEWMTEIESLCRETKLIIEAMRKMRITNIST